MGSPIVEKDLGGGIDAYHAETELAPGTAIDVIDGIARSTGSIVKRPGWRLAAGYLPVRATQYVEANGSITLTLPTTLDLSALVSTPIIVSGRTTISSAVFGQTATSVYAAAFTLNSGAHTITISGVGSAAHTETSPEIDVYGLLATAGTAPTGLTADLTSSDSAWIPNLLTKYESNAVAGLVCIRGGVPYITSAPTADTTLYPAAVSSPTTGLSGSVVLGPAFFAATPGTPPTRGTITSAGVSFGNEAAVSAVTYNSGPGTTTYTVSLPAYSASTTLSSIIRPGVDYLTITQASWASLSGEFPIVSVSATDADHIAIEVTNTANAVSGVQRSDTSGGGTAGVFTDRLPASSAVPNPPGGRLAASDAGLDGDNLLSYASTSNCVVGPLDKVISVGSGVTLGSKRSGSVIPLTSTNGLCRGDELLCSGDGLLRCVLGLNPNATQSASIVVSGGFGVGTVGTTAGLRVGDYVLLCASSLAVGEVQLTALTGTTFTFATTAPAATYSARLVGHTAWLETPVTLGLATTYQVNRRWAAIPCAYDSSLGAQPATPITNKPFQTPTDRGVTQTDYSPRFTSALVNKALYISDGLNPVKKFDGVSMQNAGIVNVQPMLLALQEESSGGITNPNQMIQVSGIATTYNMTVPAGTAGTFSAGSQVYVQSRYLGELGMGSGSFAYGVVIAQDIGVASAGTIAVAFSPGTPVSFVAATGSTMMTGLVAGTTYYLGFVGLDAFSSPNYFIYAKQSDALALNSSYIHVSPAAGTNYLHAYGDVGNIVTGTGFVKLKRGLYTTVTSVDTTNNTVTVADPLTSVLPTAALYPNIASNITANVPIGNIVTTVAVKYYSKMRLVDRNGNVSVSAGMGAQDFYVRLGVPTTVQGVLHNFPVLPDTQLARLEWEIYRTGGTAGTPPYYLVASNTYDFTASPHPVYIQFTDTVQTTQLTDNTGTGIGQTDPNSTLTAGASAGFTFDRPPLAKYATSIAARLVLANYRSPHRVTIAIRKRAGTPILPTSAFKPVFVFKAGTAAPTTFATGAGQIGLCPVATAASFACSIAQTSNTEVYMNTFGLTSNDFVYTFDGSPRSGLVGADMYGWWLTDSSLSWPRGGLVFSASTSALHSVWTVNSGSIASLQNGSPVYFRAWATNASNYPQQRTFYIQKASSTTFNLYLTQVDALAASGTNKLDPYGAVSGDFAAGDASGYPTGVFQWAQYGYAGLTGVVPVILDQAYGTAISEVAWDVGGGHAPSPTTSIEQQLANRIAAAINAGQGAYAYSNPTAQPFITARAGNDVGYATILVEAIDPSAPFNFSFIPQNQDGNFDVYVNGVLYTPAANLTSISGTVQSQQKVFPSRLSISFPNYPETHDNPYTVSATAPGSSAPSDSLTVMDINPDDGQPITGVYPFFGPSFSTAAQQNQYLLVVKGQTAYLVDPVLRAVNYVSTAGHGCEFPRTLAQAYSSIPFADHTGIQCVRGNALGSNTVWTYYGQLMERFWRDHVAASLANADVPVAAQSVYHNLWRLAVPTTASSANDCVLVYDYTREQGMVAYGQSSGIGAWSRFSGLAVGAWASFSANDYFAATDSGQVFMERRDGVATDYRDYPQQPINFDAQLRHLDGGDSAMRKREVSIVLNFRTPITTAGTQVWTQTDLDGVWRPCDSFTLERPLPTTNLRDVETRVMQSIRFSPAEKKFQYLAIRVTNSALDEPVEVVSFTVSIDPISERGVTQAAKT